MSSIKNPLDRLEPKDRRAILLLSIFLSAVILIWGVVLPSHNYYQDSKQTMIDNKELSLWIEANASAIQPVEDKSERPSGSLLEWVTGAAADNGLSISRFQPEGEEQVRIWLNDVKYEEVNALLQQLIQDFGIKIDALIIDRTSTPGLVNVQCTLG